MFPATQPLLPFEQEGEGSLRRWCCTRTKSSASTSIWAVPSAQRHCARTAGGIPHPPHVSSVDPQPGRLPAPRTAGHRSRLPPDRDACRGVHDRAHGNAQAELTCRAHVNVLTLSARPRERAGQEVADKRESGALNIAHCLFTFFELASFALPLPERAWRPTDGPMATGRRMVSNCSDARLSCNGTVRPWGDGAFSLRLRRVCPYRAGLLRRGPSAQPCYAYPCHKVAAVLDLLGFPA